MPICVAMFECCVYPVVISECRVLFKHDDDSDITCGLSRMDGAVPANTVLKGTVAQDAL
jgi:hypothetical protein